MQQVITEGFRLSPQQERLWILQESGSLPYRAQCSVLIEGAFNTALFQTALQAVVGRYEILRTIFRSVPGMTIPVQVIDNSNIVSQVYEHDLRSLSNEEQKRHIDRLFREELVRPFDLEHGSPLHLCLIRLASDKSLLIVGLHALYTDAIGLNNLVDEIRRAYEPSSQTQELSSEPMQYADISEWQNQLLESEEWEAGREYWQRQKIADCLNLKLPFEKRGDNHK